MCSQRKDAVSMLVVPRKAVLLVDHEGVRRVYRLARGEGELVSLALFCCDCFDINNFVLCSLDLDGADRRGRGIGI